MIAAHYARPVEQTLARAATLRAAPSDEADPVCELAAGEPFRMVENSVGWAWGYGGPEGRVGYVRAEALTA